MSVQERVTWFLQMPKGNFGRPHWIADELNEKIYKSGLERADKDAIMQMLTSCASRNTGKQLDDLS